MKNEKLDDIFNITSNTISRKVEEITEIEKITPTDIDQDIRKDYEYTRANVYSIIEKGQQAINQVLDLASETESPRAYEVVGQLIKNVSDATDKLLELQKKLKDLDDPKTSSKSSTNVTNALFVGSTAELSKLFKSQKQQPENNK